jgi:spore coat protein U-like protein
MPFGTYTDGEAALAGQATGSWTGNSCSGTWNIPLNAGIGKGATTTLRYMTGAATGFELQYRVFQDAAHTQNWGNTSGVDEATGTTWTPVTFYGLITAGQLPPPDTYTDTLNTATAHFTVSVTVAKACAISASNLAFNTYVGLLIDSSSTISVTCTDTTPYTVGLSAGIGHNATVTNRLMSRGTPGAGVPTLGYKLCSDGPACATNWGNTAATNWVSKTGTGALQSLTVYGQLPAGTVPAAGNYSDTITATITY